jgi:general secretion pathway protein G
MQPESRPLLDPRTPSHRPGRGGVHAGFTLIEIMAVTAMIGALAVILIPRIQGSITRAKVAAAIGDLRALQQDVDAQDTLPASLGVIGRATLSDPWGNTYYYVPFSLGPGPGGGRTDRFGISLNRRYDLYSAGEDGSPGNADDVVRASDGTYLGLISRY